MSKKGDGAYQGKHWMQQPENKEKVAAMIRKMQRGGRLARKAGTYGKRQKKMQAVAKMLVTKAKKYPTGYKSKTRQTLTVKDTKTTSLVVNGYRITLGQGEIRIENE